jgi:hypothetical protein
MSVEEQKDAETSKNLVRQHKSIVHRCPPSFPPSLPPSPPPSPPPLLSRPNYPLHEDFVFFTTDA